MYQLYKKDIFGNNVPFLVATKPFADVIYKDMKERIALVVDVPRHAQALIKL